MRELTIINQTLPIIDINFDEVKKDLNEQLQQYKSLVVTEDSLTMCKANQKGLAGLKGKVDTYRKDIKKTMSEPIAAFEVKCKELVSLIESAEQPLKDGIKVFDDLKREEKRQSALTIIAETIIKHGISAKYASQLTVLDKYTNLTAKVSEVTEDIEQRAFILLGEQSKELELLELIQDAIDTANKRIKRQLGLAEFKRYIDNGMSTKDVIQMINANTERIFEAENPKPVEVVEEVIVPVVEVEVIPDPVVEQPKPVVEVIPVFVEETPKAETMWSVEMNIVGTASQFGALKQFMLSNSITYKANSQKVVE